MSNSDSSSDHFEDTIDNMAENNTRTKAIEIPIFNGTSKDSMSTRAWIHYVERCKRIANWTDDKTAEYAQLALREIAADWIENLTEARNADIDSWPTFKALFEARFHKKATLAERTVIKASLTQNKNESIQDFYDRVDSGNYILDENWPPLAEGATAAQITQDANAKASHHKVNVFNDFLQGMNPEIRAQVVLQNPTTLVELQSVAVQVESALSNKKKQLEVAEISMPSPLKSNPGPSMVAAVETTAEKSTIDMNDLKVCVDFVKSQMSKDQNKGSNNRGRGQNNYRGNNTRRGFRGYSRGFRGNSRNNGRRNLECYYCGGSAHISTTCEDRLEDQKNGIYNPRNMPKNHNVANVNAYSYENMFSKNDFTV